uniref:Uncharacterized protein n=1 Tax=Arundo donax TaxID=35708 RepID=A0A0A9H6N7_ARUDO
MIPSNSKWKQLIQYVLERRLPLGVFVLDAIDPGLEIKAARHGRVIVHLPCERVFVFLVLPSYNGDDSEPVLWMATG